MNQTNGNKHYFAPGAIDEGEHDEYGFELSASRTQWVVAAAVLGVLLVLAAALVGTVLAVVAT